jgi:hypothetical protein
VPAAWCSRFGGGPVLPAGRQTGLRRVIRVGTALALYGLCVIVGVIARGDTFGDRPISPVWRWSVASIGVLLVSRTTARRAGPVGRHRGR